MSRSTELQSLLESQVARVVRRDFLAEVQSLRAQGLAVPDEAKAAEHFQVCFESSDPRGNLDLVLNAYRRQPKREAATPAPAAHQQRTMPRLDERANRESAHRALGIQFSADDIDTGLKIGRALEDLYAGAGR